MEKTGIFLSHISEEAELAVILKRHIEQDFLGLVDVFVSSDHHSVRMGQKWLAEVERHRASTSCMLILCSEQSVARPWINFEAGAAWLRSIPVIPICHTGMTPGSLPKPLDMLPAFPAHQFVGLKGMYDTIAGVFPMRTPAIDMDVLAGEVESFENQYGVLIPIRKALEGIRNVEPVLAEIFAPEIDEEFYQLLEIPTWQYDQLRPHFAVIQNFGLIEIEEGGLTLGRVGSRTRFTLKVLESYRSIAEDFAAVTKYSASWRRPVRCRLKCPTPRTR